MGESILGMVYACVYRGVMCVCGNVYVDLGVLRVAFYVCMFGSLLPQLRWQRSWIVPMC